MYMYTAITAFDTGGGVRKMTVLFIKLNDIVVKIGTSSSSSKHSSSSSSSSSNSSSDCSALTQVHAALRHIQEGVVHFQATLRQFIIDDKVSTASSTNHACAASANIQLYVAVVACVICVASEALPRAER
jgi:hypothetical protein